MPSSRPVPRGAGASPGALCHRPHAHGPRLTGTPHSASLDAVRGATLPPRPPATGSLTLPDGAGLTPPAGSFLYLFVLQSRDRATHVPKSGARVPRPRGTSTQAPGPRGHSAW